MEQIQILDIAPQDILRGEEGINAFLYALLVLEAGYEPAPQEALKEAFAQARQRAFRSAADPNRATFMGIPYSFYCAYCRTMGKMQPSIAAFPHMTFEAWREFINTYLWQRMRLDNMKHTASAVAMADFAFLSGVPKALKTAQHVINTIEAASPPHGHWSPLSENGLMDRATIAALKRITYTVTIGQHFMRVLCEARLNLLCQQGLSLNRVRALTALIDPEAENLQEA